MTNQIPLTWKSNSKSDYNFSHIIQILIKKDGWTQVPLFKGREGIKNERSS